MRELLLALLLCCGCIAWCGRNMSCLWGSNEC